MIVYAESSAVLSWLLGEPRQSAVIDALENAEHIITSAITPVECARGLLRARLDKRISALQEAATLRMLDEAIDAWSVVELSDAVSTIARQSFPREPVRSMDALHLASALIVQESVGELAMLSFDDRVRHNAAALGMTVTPTE